MKLSDNKLLLLAKGLVRGEEVGTRVKGGYITFDDAEEVYSSNESALSALNALRAWGFIRISSTPGIFYVVRAPPEAFTIARNLRKEIEAMKSGNTGMIEETSEISGLEVEDE